MDRTELEEWLRARGFQQDRWGHFKKEIERTAPDGATKMQTFRYKMQKNSVRCEVDLGSFWHKKWGEYYCNLEFDPETGKLRRIKKEAKENV